jgi:2-polyprenyl-6-methoxyphenol hydroxylase-like FAD-dependent oxidoreductase
MTSAKYSTRCCIAGGGPAGMVLGLLLARDEGEAVRAERIGTFYFS